MFCQFGTRYSYGKKLNFEDFEGVKDMVIVNGRKGGMMHVERNSNSSLFKPLELNQLFIIMLHL
jgi:hypothetical protein